MESSTVATQAITALTDGLTTIASNMGSMIVAVVPIALGVVGAVIAVKYGVKFFRGLAGK